MPEVIIYPPFINTDFDKLCAVYSLLEQMRLEHNRQHDIYASNPSQYSGQWFEYIKRFREKQRPLLLEQNRLRDAIRRTVYSDEEWRLLASTQNTDMGEPLWGNREILKKQSTEATSILLDQLKAVKLDLLPPQKEADPTEDFTTYTEVDTNSRYTVTAGKITITGLTADDSGQYVYADKGVDHFGDFEHKYQICLTACTLNSTYLFLWALANSVGQYDQAGAIYFYYNDSWLVVLEVGNGYDYWSGGQLNVDYFVTTQRDGTAFTSEIRTGSHTGILQDTLSFTCGTAAFRYIYGTCGFDFDEPGRVVSGYVQDLDIGEGATEKSSDDSGNGTDTRASNNPFASLSKSETGSGEEGIPTQTAILARNESGSGVDTLTSLLGSLVKSDSGGGLDSRLSFLAGLEAIDSGNGIDSLMALLVDVLTSEMGSGVEQGLLSLLLSSSESGAGAEAVVYLLSELLKGDSGSGVEGISGRGLVLPDSGTGVDSLSALLAAVPGSEAGSGIEQSLLSMIVAKFSAETGSGVELAALITLLVSGDGGTGSDLGRLLAKAVLGSDGGSGRDALKVLAGKAGSDVRLPGRQGQVRMPSKGVNL